MFGILRIDGGPIVTSKKTDYSGKQRSQPGQYLEVLRLVGQGSVPLTVESDWPFPGFPRVVWQSGRGPTSTLASSIPEVLAFGGVLVAS